MRPPDKSSRIHIPFAWSFLLYLCLSGLVVTVHNRIVDSNAMDARKILHRQVLSNEAPAPVQYRVMTVYLAEGLQRLGFSFQSSYLILRGVTTLLAALLLHRFLACYLPPPWNVWGVTLFFAWLPLTYINYYMQETDPLNLVFYLGAFLLIRRRKDLWLIPLLAVSLLNRETPVLIPLVWLFYRWDELPAGTTVARFSGYTLLGLGVYALLRYVFGHHPAYSEFYYLWFNLKSWETYYYFFLIFGAFLLPSWKGWSTRPKFLRRLALFIPFFLVFHLIIPIFKESRLILPLMPVFLALGLSVFLDDRDLAPAHAEEDRPVVWRPPLPSTVVYGVLWAVFTGSIYVFSAYIDRVHVKEFSVRQKAEQYYERGREFYDLQSYTEAVQEWERGLLFDPDHFDMHYLLAGLYARMYDLEKARKHAQECHRISPDDPRFEALEEMFRVTETNYRQAFRPSVPVRKENPAR
ncbi:MAG TPA: tetratricopeptide repeat protein [Elusimicrobiota bacterium]|nr:tetratricopeptide repeat protein [Elusimicrobiota bacterium]